jgi:hypothetical protein
VRELVFALDADAAGQQQWRALAHHAVLQGKRVAALAPTAYGGQKDVNAAWVAETLAMAAGAVPAVAGEVRSTVPETLRKAWEERVAIMVVDGGLPRAGAERLAWTALHAPQAAP